MAFTLASSLAPMEAASVEEIPRGEMWQYEPKWDGFRCLAFRSGKDVELRSKSGQLLSRYFPEIVSAIAKLKADNFVLDGGSSHQRLCKHTRLKVWVLNGGTIGLMQISLLSKAEAEGQ